MSTFTITCPVSNGDWAFVDGNGTIEAWGTASGNEKLSKIYARCYKGTVGTSSPLPQKPFISHGADVVEGDVSGDGSSWSFTNTKRVKGATADDTNQTLIVWADFLEERCYQIQRRLFVGTAGSGSGCGGGGAYGIPPLFRVAPRFYAVSLEADPFDGADPTAGEMPHSFQPKRTSAILEYDEVAGSYSAPAWRCSANGDGDWLLRVRTMNGQVLASLAWTPPRNGSAPQPLIWDRLGWEANGRNILQHDAANGGARRMPEVSVAPVG